MKGLSFWGIVTLFGGLVACGSRPHSSVSAEGVPVINVEAAMEDLQPALKLSDFGESIRYVPLETTDSCLVALWGVKIFGNHLAVTSSIPGVTFNFNKETGRYVAQLGHRGNDPEGYWGTTPYYNEGNGLFYFERLPNQLQRYDAQGKYHGKAWIPTPPEMPVAFVFEDSLVIGFHEMPSYAPNQKRLLTCFTEKGVLKDSVQRSESMMSFLKESTSLGMVRISLGKIEYVLNVPTDEVWVDLQSSCPLWKCEGKVRVKEGLCDTIFTLENHRDLIPAYVFHMGKYALSPQARREGKSRDKLVPYAVLETSEKIFFKAVGNLYETVRTRSNKEAYQLYNGIYDKRTGVTRMAPEKGGIVDDLTGDLSYEIWACGSPQKEFVFSLEAHDIVAWQEEHPEAKENPKLAPLLKVQMEDNPVVVIVK